MSETIRFLLNDRDVETECPAGLLVLDYLRKNERLTGTKEGCKEGDCGACAILIGELEGDAVRYQPVTSCLVPLGEMQGKHVVSVEGFRMDKLTPVQQAIVDEGGTQCGYCTPGIVVSLHGLLMDDTKGLALEDVKYALGGNLCRCTGYRSLKNCAEILNKEVGPRLGSRNRIEDLVKAEAIPEYFKDVPARLKRIAGKTPGNGRKLTGNGKNAGRYLIAGGTDLYVQVGESIPDSPVKVLNLFPEMKGIRRDDGAFRVGALTTFEEFGEHADVQRIIPDIQSFNHLIASWHIRNRATMSGNIINASPIGDLTVLLLALESELIFRNGNSERTIPMKSFYKGYKKMDRREDEILVEITFPDPPKGTRINFEKVSKRTCLDIATVNSACKISCANGDIANAQFSLGGVAPIPLFLEETCDYLEGRPLNWDTVWEAVEISQEEISPISDIRGSAEYKRLLAQQFMIAHFTKLFPGKFKVREYYEAR